MEKVCPNCGEKLPGDSSFCMKCGTKIEGDGPGIEQEQPVQAPGFWQKNKKKIIIAAAADCSSSSGFCYCECGTGVKPEKRAGAWLVQD